VIPKSLKFLDLIEINDYAESREVLLVLLNELIQKILDLPEPAFKEKFREIHRLPDDYPGNWIIYIARI